MESSSQRFVPGVAAEPAGAASVRAGGPGVLVADAAQRVLGASDGFFARTRLGPADVVGRTLAELAPALARNPALVQPAALDIVPVFDGGGQVAHFTATLREGAAAPPHAHELLDRIPAGVVVHAADARAVYANCHARALLGPALDGMRGPPGGARGPALLRADGTVLAPDDYPAVTALRHGAMVSGFIVGLPTDGAPRWLICNAFPVHAPDGSIDEIVSCYTDCTRLKQIEQSLLKSEERLRLVLQGSTDAPWDWDLVSNELYYSERYWEMVGYRPGELPARPETWMSMLDPEDSERAIGFVRDLLRGRERTYSIEFRLRHRDGHAVPILSRGFVLRDASGRAIRMSGTNTDLTQAKQAERRIYELAYFDYLTGLPNRRLLVEQLAKILPRSQRTGQFGALLFIDLDNFKLLNDTLGHDVGDQLLCEVAERLRRTVRASDHLSRLGGDEFVVVLENLGATGDGAVVEASLVGAKLLAALAQPFQLAARPSVSTPSIGVALFGDGPASVDVLLRQADLAMYRAKAEGRNTVRFFDPGMQAAADRQIALEHDLREGIRRQRFELHCQPQFDVAGRLVGAEVLLRSNHTGLGLVGPAEFIGLAETSGLIVPLGAMVLLETCRVLARWARDPRLACLTLAVNVSVQQLRQPDFVERVLAALLETGAAPDKLRLELTESVFAEDVEAVAGKMHALRAHAVSFSLDDFGTGYSSLSYLKRLPLAELKIDRSFVKDLPEDANAGAIVDAILGLARTLNLQVVAEGVETQAQRDFLVAHGCALLQGYLLGRPVPIEAFERDWGSAGQEPVR
ncbi:putative bifunctional diguanylate cyclase/phosphodiesterase [Massilia jejuensis]|uniref:Bifunctional diguanylate cyclase/phosphodiesterase n=1 Tax=Massilia jejuensis TaxID=648894 RepID=A0ABW0PC43_9BURK